MHDTAYIIGGKFLTMYCATGCETIVELGSLNVNGSLRDFQPPNSSYVGIDLEPGDSVDICVGLDQPLPFAAASIDAVLASSVFEHDPVFWQTFLELCRVVRDGGLIYINSPSNGMVHRYPLDCWRFYPDSSAALERWARAQGFDLTCVESFIAERKDDQWNDFVAVFQRGPVTPRKSGTFLHEVVPCRNVRRFDRSDLSSFSADTQDMELVRSGTAHPPRRASSTTPASGGTAQASGVAPPITITAYARRGEDVRLARCFPAPTTGFYIELGGGHPMLDSATCHFSLSGWRGLNYVPPEALDGFLRYRPRDTNLAISEDVHSWPQHVTDVEARDALFLSAESWLVEANGLACLPDTGLRPRVVVLRGVSERAEAIAGPILETAGYELAVRDGTSLFFVAQDHAADLRAIIAQPVVGLEHHGLEHGLLAEVTWPSAFGHWHATHRRIMLAHAYRKTLAFDTEAYLALLPPSVDGLTRDAIERVYQTVLGRSADPAALIYWLGGSEASLTDLVTALCGSAEYRNSRLTAETDQLLQIERLPRGDQVLMLGADPQGSDRSRTHYTDDGDRR